ncbi:CBS domain-containing protein [Saccharomonospora sp.]|uniref:CBS domain-containing protein n=1 Tax=Saccharomonospora sp. TaxID=33913 RepID=UPI0026225533|nr:CBS domain-containing protein [Saccharomonospora sp.]
MAQLVRDLMTPQPVTMPGDAPARDAARRMRDDDIGDVLVVDEGQLRGIVTDRDLVIRGLAERDNLSNTRLRELCSENLTTARPDEEASNVIAKMREHAIRRIPVVEDGDAIGVFSIGDAAMERDPNSALGDISAAQGNR